jgi:fructose-1,6-bisphosphatase/inositol monophosphatase family enzyme
MSLDKEIETAIRASRLAAELALRFFAGHTASWEKADLSPVTEADQACEKLIAGILSESFPHDGIQGEEGASRDSRSGRRWLIDPIDGTRDFVRRTPFWSIQIALQEGSEVKLGVINLPCLGEIVHAVSGSGAYWNGSRMAASETSTLDKAILSLTGFRSVWDAWPRAAIVQLTRQCWTVRSYSGCYDVVMLARGKADIWLSGSGMEWDYAPARILARETGLVYLTKDGKDRIDAGHCLICVPGLESELRALLQIP